MKNIAIMGSSGGAGKDTVADIITDITGIDYQKISLAQEIHRICNKLSSNPQRNELQAVGESMRDIFGENVWMDLTDRTMHGPTIVPDIRKLLEYSHYVMPYKKCRKIDNFKPPISYILQPPSTNGLDKITLTGEVQDIFKD